MIQGGDPEGTGNGGPGYKFRRRDRGSRTTSRSRASSPWPTRVPEPTARSSSSPWPHPWLTGKHTIFGEVVEGQETVDKIVTLPRDRNDKPTKDIKVNSVTIERV